MKRGQHIAALTALGGFALAASAQSINIDFGDRNSLPDSTFGGVGMAGVWNAPDLQSATPVPLVDLAGNPSGVTIVSLQGPRDSGGSPDPNLSGNIAALLDDWLWGTGDVFFRVEIANLVPGRYLFIAYAIRTTLPNQLTLIEVSNPGNGGSNASVVGGPWSGQFVEGVTHARFGINAQDGRIRFVNIGGFFGQSGLCNGIQLVKVCDADLTSTAIAGQPGFGVPNGVLNNDDFFYYLDRFVAEDPGEADLTTSAIPGSPGYGVPNGVINNDDFFYYLALFSAGC